MAAPQSAIPSVDRLLRHAGAAALIDAYGRDAVVGAVRDDLAAMRRTLTPPPCSPASPPPSKRCSRPRSGRCST